MAKINLTAEELRSLLSYCMESGIFSRLTGRKKGLPAGSCNRGYFYIGLGGRNGDVFAAHRLAWLYVHGSWPIGEIDHIDGNPSNNAITNLREVSRIRNAQNQRKPRTSNTHGFFGVWRNKKRWGCSIRVNGKRFHIGTFDTPEEAEAAYIAAKRELHPACTI